jgi:hypothetical protein
MRKTKQFYILATWMLFMLLAAALFLQNSPQAAAQYTYTPMEKIPGFENATDFPNFLLALTKFGIWTVGIVALFMITVGGFMYMTSAGNTSRMDTAKKVIYDSLFGLIIALASWLLLFIINPDLVKVTLSIKPVSAPTTPVTIPPPAGAAGTCQGLPTQTGISSQCGDVSPALSGLLSCIYGKLGTKASISSISDSAGYARCKNNYSQPPCAHAQGSCHYGGTCTDGSHAVDFSVGTSSASSAELIQAGTACGGSIINEGSVIHVSVPNGCCRK